MYLYYICVCDMSVIGAWTVDCRRPASDLSHPSRCTHIFPERTCLTGGMTADCIPQAGAHALYHIDTVYMCIYTFVLLLEYLHNMCLAGDWTADCTRLKARAYKRKYLYMYKCKSLYVYSYTGGGRADSRCPEA